MFDGESIVLRDFQRLLGEGQNRPRDGATPIRCRRASSACVDLPETSPGALAGAVPIIRDAPGAAVTLAAGGHHARRGHRTFLPTKCPTWPSTAARGASSRRRSARPRPASAACTSPTRPATGSNSRRSSRRSRTPATSRSRFSPAINKVAFNGVGGDDIHLDANTGEPATTTVTESIRITEVSSVDGNGRGINIINNKNAVTIENYTFDGGTTATGALRFSGSEAGPPSPTRPSPAARACRRRRHRHRRRLQGDLHVHEHDGDRHGRHGLQPQRRHRRRQLHRQDHPGHQRGGRGHRPAAHTGTVTFNEAETDEGVITATNGTGLQFDDADGAYTFNDAVVLPAATPASTSVNDSDGAVHLQEDDDHQPDRHRLQPRTAARRP